MLNSTQLRVSKDYVTVHGYSAQVCRLHNTSSVPIDYSLNSGEAVTVAAGGYETINITSSTSEVRLKRTDGTNTAVDVIIEWGPTAEEAYEQSLLAIDKAYEKSLLAIDNATVSASDITDASATGLSVLTGTAAQGRTALEVGTFAVASKSDAYTIGTDSADELLGGTVYVTASAVMTLPAVSAGKHCTIIVLGAVAVTITPNASDRIILDGAALADGVSIVSNSHAGDVAHVRYESANGWYISTNGWNAVQGS